MVLETVGFYGLGVRYDIPFSKIHLLYVYHYILLDLQRSIWYISLKFNIGKYYKK